MVDFLNQFEGRYRGPIKNAVLHAISQGSRDLNSIRRYIKSDCRHRMRFGNPLSDHYQTLLIVMYENNFVPFMEECIRYLDLPYEKRKRVKQIKRSAKQMQKKLITDIFNKNRPLSWSAISSWNYSKEDWAEKYIENKQSPTSKEMEFGKKIGKLLETDPTYLPQIPRHSKMEHKFCVKLSGIPLIGYADSFCDQTNKKLLEFKTGKKAWDQKRADEHGQITMYCLMNYITHKIKPEDMDISLIWLPTQDNGDFSISFVEPIEDNIKVFKTKRTMQDILVFAGEIKKIYKQMEEYIKNYEVLSR